jgi:hypothetical protein
MIDRRKVIERHNPHYKSVHKNAPLSVGNGTFCFTADFTGLQTFFDEYSASEDAFPLCTMAEWGWHSYSPRQKENEALLRLTPFDTCGRTVYYASDDTGQEELFKKIRINTHKFHLGKIGFAFLNDTLSMDECKPVSQILSLWEGILSSEFLINGETVKTETFVHPEEDILYIRVFSPLLKDGKLRIIMEFPYGSHKKTAADFSAHHAHTTRLCESTANTISLERELNDTLYKVTINGNWLNVLVNEQLHVLQLVLHSENLELSVKFEPLNIPVLSDKGTIYNRVTNNNDSFNDAQQKCKSFWEHYWCSGGFIDFSGSTDYRAMELERRLTLSQYLIAIQSRGNLPPAETGLTCNSWYGKFHLEMHFWHHAQFALWGRAGELIKSLNYYKKILPVAKEIAASQGYSGARWPKMCDPSGKNTPSSIAVFLIWQQPHPIMLAELCWRTNQCRNTLLEYRDIVVSTAEFMKSFIQRQDTRFVLGPPYIPAQERHDPKMVLNAAFELEYFRWGLRKADEWLERLGEQGHYSEIAENLSLPAIKDGVYIAHANCPDTFDKQVFYSDHPSMLAMYGVLDSDKIDCGIMSATLDKVLSRWDKNTFYGWDFPMMAMTACRLGRYKDAVEILLTDSPKNAWLENGHNRMTGDNALPLYLPGNGGLLLATAMMAAGYGDKKGSSFPEGFVVNAEGISKYI